MRRVVFLGVVFFMALAPVGSAQAAALRPKQSVVARLFIWIQGKLIPPVPAAEPTTEAADRKLKDL